VTTALTTRFGSVAQFTNLRYNLAFLATCWLVSAQAAVVPVTDTISASIAAAQPGDTVIVSGPRAFHEHLIIDKPLRLVGTNLPVLDADGSGTAVTIQVPGVEIVGVTIQNSGRDLGACDSAILITAPRARIAGCQIHNDGFGIYIRGATECTIKQNDIAGRHDYPSAKRGNGIHLWKTKGNQLLENAIHDKRDGMYLSYADENTIAGNRVWDTRFGIHYMYSHWNRLLTNSLTQNAVGATLMFSRQSVIQGNRVWANRRHGMVLKQLDNSQILDNVISGQNRGLFVQQAVQNRFEGNIISTNDIGLYLSNCSEQNVFVRNAFIQNTDQVWQPPFETEQGRLSPNTFYQKGRGNYWSDYVGSDRNHDSIGDTPYHETDVFGRIIDRHPEARILALSPAVALLRKGEELFPLLDTTGVTDLYPLIRAPAPSQTVLSNIANAGARTSSSASPHQPSKCSSEPVHRNPVVEARVHAP
jgi:nitrous oxidase accessory protein